MSHGQCPVVNYSTNYHGVDQMKELQLMKDEGGSVLIIALIMLVLLTLLGISATSTSNLELQISNNEKNYKKAFYVANAGIEHARAMLTQSMVAKNSALLAQGNAPRWTFALNGSVVSGVASGYTKDTGVVWINDATFTPSSNYSYTVTVFNNQGAGDSASTDGDNRVWARADVDGPNNVHVGIQVLLIARSSGDAITGYSAQSGAGSGKSYSSEDLNATDLTGSIKTL